MVRASCVLVRDPPDKGAVVVRLIHKAQAMDVALNFVKGGELKPGDLVVLWLICTKMDNRTGECTRRYEAIAGDCGISRATAVRAIARLKAAGLLEIRERYYKQSRGKTATAFRLSAVNANVCSPVNRGSVQACTTMESRLSRIPDGRDQLSTQALSGQQAVSNPRASPTTVAAHPPSSFRGRNTGSGCQSDPGSAAFST